MPVDKRKAIIADIRTRLLEITTSNAFHQTVKSVLKRAKNTEIETPASYPIIWMEVGSESSPFVAFETTSEMESVFTIELVLGLNPAQNEDYVDKMEDFIRDVKAKLHADPRRSNLAQWSAVVAVSEPVIIADRSLVEARVTVETEYVVLPTDP